MSRRFDTILALAQDRQHKRLLRLSFPRNDGPQAVLLANRLDADEGLARDFTFVVEVLADHPGIALKDMLGKMVSIDLVRIDGSLRYFTGFVFEFSLSKFDGAIAFYKMVLKPWLAYLALRNNNVIFHGQTLREQTDSIFRDYGQHAYWDCKVRALDAAMTMATQFDESDHNYLHRRWEDAGWHYFYNHSASGHQLLLCDSSIDAEPIDGDSTDIRFQRHGGSNEEDAIGDWAPVRRIVASSVALSSFDFKDPRPAHVALPTLNWQGQALPVESYDYAGAYGMKNAQDQDAKARLRMEEIETHAKQVDAVGNSRFAAPGRWFRLSGHFNSSSLEKDTAKSEFLIVSVRHTASNNYLQQVDTPARYSNRISCTRKSITWRPGRGFNSRPAKILAPQTAVVVGPEGQNIHTDEHGRVRVQFHWDRIGKNDEKSSAWVRVSSGWAGSELGFAALPRIGSECIVQWLDGNPDHPIITGRVHNASNMSPWKQGSQQALTGLRSRELTPNGGNHAGGRSNHLVLDDTDGKIQAQLKSDHLHSQLSLGHIGRIDDNAGRKDGRGEGFALETGGAGALRSARGLLLSTDSRARAVGGTLSRDELVRCLEQALDIAKGLGDAVVQHQGGQRDAKPQQALTEAVDALGHGCGDEAEASSAGAGGQAVIAISAPAGIASATPKNQTYYAGQNIDAVAGRNVQHYAAQSVLQTAGKDIEQFALDGDIRSIANQGKIILQAQQNAIELTADKSVSMLSAKDHILIAADKHITLTSGGAYIKIADGNIDIVCPGNLIFKSASRSFSGPGSIAAAMPSFDSGDAGRKFILHRDGDKLDTLVDHHYKITLDDGQLIEGKTAADGLTKLAEKDAMHIAAIQVWKEPA
jgi:type VI secretion system secreted protein VgrG